MKVGQKTIVRWISKQVAKRGLPLRHKASAGALRELDGAALRYVAGGTDAPNKFW